MDQKNVTNKLLLFFNCFKLDLKTVTNKLTDIYSNCIESDLKSVINQPLNQVLKLLKR